MILTLRLNMSIRFLSKKSRKKFRFLKEQSFLQTTSIQDKMPSFQTSRNSMTWRTETLSMSLSISIREAQELSNFRLSDSSEWFLRSNRRVKFDKLLVYSAISQLRLDQQHEQFSHHRSWHRRNLRFQKDLLRSSLLYHSKDLHRRLWIHSRIRSRPRWCCLLNLAALHSICSMTSR